MWGTVFFPFNPWFPNFFLLASRHFLIYFHISNRILTNAIFDSVSTVYGNL